MKIKSLVDWENEFKKRFITFNGLDSEGYENASPITEEVLDFIRSLVARVSISVSEKGKKRTKKTKLTRAQEIEQEIYFP